MLKKILLTTLIVVLYTLNVYSLEPVRISGRNALISGNQSVTVKCSDQYGTILSSSTVQNVVFSTGGVFSFIWEDPNVGFSPNHFVSLSIEGGIQNFFSRRLDKLIEDQTTFGVLIDPDELNADLLFRFRNQIIISDGGREVIILDPFNGDISGLTLHIGRTRTEFVVDSLGNVTFDGIIYGDGSGLTNININALSPGDPNTHLITNENGLIQWVPMDVDEDIILGEETSGDYVATLLEDDGSVTVVGGTGEGSNPTVAINPGFENHWTVDQYFEQNIYVSNAIMNPEWDPETEDNMPVFINDMLRVEGYSNFKSTVLIEQDLGVMGEIYNPVPAWIMNGDEGLPNPENGFGMPVVINDDLEIAGTITEGIWEGSTIDEMYLDDDVVLLGDNPAAGDISGSFENGFTINDIELGAQTTGDYVATLSEEDGSVTVLDGIGEGSMPTVAINPGFENHWTVDQHFEENIYAYEYIVNPSFDEETEDDLPVFIDDMLKVQGFSHLYDELEVEGDGSFHQSIYLDQDLVIQGVIYNPIQLNWDGDGPNPEDGFGMPVIIDDDLIISGTILSGTWEGSTIDENYLDDDVVLLSDNPAVGDITGSFENGFTINDIELGTKTTGDYVATLSEDDGSVTVTNGTGESSMSTVAINAGFENHWSVDQYFEQNVLIEQDLGIQGVIYNPVPAEIMARNEGLPNPGGDFGMPVLIDDDLEISGTITAGTWEGSTIDEMYLDDDVVLLGDNPAAGHISGSFENGFTIDDDAVALGTKTTGDYVSTLTEDDGSVTVTNGSGEGSTPTVAINTSHENTWEADQYFDEDVTLGSDFDDVITIQGTIVGGMPPMGRAGDGGASYVFIDDNLDISSNLYVGEDVEVEGSIKIGNSIVTNVTPGIININNSEDTTISIDLEDTPCAMLFVYSDVDSTDTVDLEIINAKIGQMITIIPDQSYDTINLLDYSEDDSEEIAFAGGPMIYTMMWDGNEWRLINMSINFIGMGGGN